MFKVADAGMNTYWRLTMTPLPDRGTIANIRIQAYLTFLNTRIIGLHVCRSLKRFLQECVSAVQGHPRSLILVPIESVYATSY